MNKNLIVVLALALAASPLVLAQRGGSGGQQRQSRGTSVGSGQMSNSGTLDQTKDQTRDRIQDKTRQTDRDRLHTQATSQQRSNFHTFSQQASQVSSQTHALAKASHSRSFNTETLHRQRAELTEQVRAMTQNQERLMNGLGDEQKNAAQEHNRAMQQAHERIQNQLQMMDQELSSSDHNRKRVEQQARATEREMNTYQKHLRKMGNDLGLQTE
jgi:hypothetical protein